MTNIGILEKNLDAICNNVICNIVWWGMTKEDALSNNIKSAYMYHNVPYTVAYTLIKGRFNAITKDSKSMAKFIDNRRATTVRPIHNSNIAYIKYVYNDNIDSIDNLLSIITA